MYKRLDKRFPRIGFGGLGQDSDQGLVWNQVANFEGGVLTPNSQGGADSVAGGGAANITIYNTAPLAGKYSAQVDNINAAARYLVLSDPDDEKDFTFEFLINVSNMVMGNNEVFIISRLASAGACQMLDIELRYTVANGFIIRYSARPDGCAPVTSINYIIDQFTTHLITVAVKCAQNAGDNDGYYKVYVDGVLIDAEENVDNDTHALTEIYLGHVGGMDAGTSGQLIVDEMKWINKRMV